MGEKLFIGRGYRTSQDLYRGRHGILSKTKIYNASVYEIVSVVPVFLKVNTKIKINK